MLQAQVNYWTLMENKRHNLESERLGFATLDESKRHNVVTENLGFKTLDESIRHNKASESISWANYSETVRHNKRTEDIAQYEAGTSRLNAYTKQDEVKLKSDQFEWDKFQFASGYGLSAKDTETRRIQADTSAYSAETQRRGLWFNLIGDTISAVGRYLGGKSKTTKKK